MFTGLIETQGVITAITKEAKVWPITIKATWSPEGLIQAGDSIAVNGICLTVTRFVSGGFVVEAVPETERRTTLPTWKTGDRVNLERALRIGGRLDGHWVSGHVDTVVKAINLVNQGMSKEVEFGLPTELDPLVAEKGSVALDGVSLTVVRKMQGRFSVALIPHTLKGTSLVDLRAGRQVNLEVDLLARYVASLLSASPKSVTWQGLKNHGFF